MSKFSEAAGLPTTTHESGVTNTTAPPVPPADQPSDNIRKL